MKRVLNTNQAITGAKETARGIFWVIDDKLCAFPFIENSEYGVAKSGTTYNHKKLWEYVKPKGCNKPFDYYPRGRVEFSGKGRPVIYMNPNIDNSYVKDIKTQFGLREDPQIRYDYSVHYRCHLDDGYSSEQSKRKHRR